MSVFILSGQNCYTAPLHISPSAVNTVSSWSETSLPTVKYLLHERYNRIPLHTFQSQNSGEIYNSFTDPLQNMFNAPATLTPPPGSFSQGQTNFSYNLST